MTNFKFVKKRDGRIVPFDENKIVQAVSKAFNATGEGGLEDAQKVAEKVVRELHKKFSLSETPDIESIQDVVEEQLIVLDYPKTAKAYILYRQERTMLREQRKQIPERVKELAIESKKYFKDNALGEFIYYRSYSRWIEEEGRRETWVETVQRYLDFMKEKVGNDLTNEEYAEIKEYILNQKALPSMRLLWSAGKGVNATNVAAYNCSYIAPTKLRDFGEIVYILMCGTGVGFSVEQQTSQKLPQIKKQTGKKLKPFVIEDSKVGWADSVVVGMETWFDGKDIDFDFSQLRPQGARLKTMGGRSSGPGPLREALSFIRKKILENQGKRLLPVDVHDVICKIGEVVVMGGVRRSALLSLSDLDDPEMRAAKTGQFFLTEPQRSMANNSAVYNDGRPSAKVFLDEWISLAKSGTGERGIFNRGGLPNQLPKRRWKYFEKGYLTSGTNPCGEIVLKSKEFCNLTEVVARASDTKETLLKKIRIATILGTFQSTLTDFQYLSKEWKNNCEEERLLGVSITGQWDSPAVRRPETLAKMKEYALEVNKEYAKRFGINPSTCVTCVKPSGTVSQLVDAASGQHPRHSPYYVRRVRISATDSLFKMFKDQKFPFHPEVGQRVDEATTYVLEFPVKAPKNAVFRNDLTAMEQLEHWKIVKENYTEHNPSVTISVGENEWIEVANWLYNHWTILGGLSFLPREDYAYRLAPYEEINKEQYEALVNVLPKIDFSQILLYEQDDETQGAKELACVSGTCEVTI